MRSRLAPTWFVVTLATVVVAIALQIPTTETCLEELLTLGERDGDRWPELVVPDGREGPRILPLHAEVEGGPFAEFCQALLQRIRALGLSVCTLESLAEELLAQPAPPPRFEACRRPLPGRSGTVFAPTG